MNFARFMLRSTSSAMPLVAMLFSSHVLGASNAIVQVTEHKIYHQDEREKAGSTLAAFQFEVSLFDPNAQFNLVGGTDLFSAAENTEKEMDEGKIRKQNLFFTITNSE